MEAMHWPRYAKPYSKILINYGHLLELLGWNRRITWRKEIFGNLSFGGGKAMEPEVIEAESLSNGLQQSLKPSASRVEMSSVLYSKRLIAFTHRFYPP